MSASNPEQVRAEGMREAFERAAQICRYYLKHQEFDRQDGMGDFESGVTVTCANLEASMLLEADSHSPAASPKVEPPAATEVRVDANERFDACLIREGLEDRPVTVHAQLWECWQASLASAPRAAEAVAWEVTGRDGPMVVWSSQAADVYQNSGFGIRPLYAATKKETT